MKQLFLVLIIALFKSTLVQSYAIETPASNRDQTEKPNAPEIISNPVQCGCPPTVVHKHVQVHHAPTVIVHKPTVPNQPAPPVIHGPAYQCSPATTVVHHQTPTVVHTQAACSCSQPSTVVHTQGACGCSPPSTVVHTQGACGCSQPSTVVHQQVHHTTTVVHSPAGACGCQRIVQQEAGGAVHNSPVVIVKKPCQCQVCTGIHTSIPSLNDDSSSDSSSSSSSDSSSESSSVSSSELSNQSDGD